MDSLLSLSNYTYNGGQHGIQVKANTVLTLAVPGNVKVTISQCQYGSGTLTVTDTAGNAIVSEETMVAATDGGTYSFDYTGNATTLTFAMTGGYVHTLTVESTATNILYGDVNDSGAVDATDASLIAKYNLGLITLDADALIRADVNGSNTVDATDASLLSKFNLGIITKFPVEG